MKTFLTAALAALVSIALPCAAHAGTISFTTVVTTAPLIGNAQGPFSLDFQLNNGSGAASNTVVLSNFNFGGGSATGLATTSGGATGDLTSGVTITDSGFFNELYQGFTPGTLLSFNVLLTTNVDAPTPDAFSFSILDSTLASIATTGFADTFLFVNIHASDLSFADLQTGSSLDPVGVTATVVPEPASLLLVGAGLLVARRGLRRR